MTLPRFLVTQDALATRRTILSGPELRHLRVRRLRVGSTVILADGSGSQRYGTVIDLTRQQAIIDLIEPQTEPCESPLRLVLALALLKADTIDLVIEKVTELGVTEVLLFTSTRSVVREASAHRLARWHRIARSATKQCQRNTIPPVSALFSFDTLLNRKSESLRLLFWEGAPDASRGKPMVLAEDIDSALAVVGPEGGFTHDEVQRAANAGFHVTGLGPRTLRAGTAGIAAVTICQFLWGDLAFNARSTP